MDYKALSDVELTGLLQKDDEIALAELYNRYWDKMLVVAFNRLRRTEESEEIVQDVFVKLWQYRHTLVLKYSLATYLAVSVKYGVINVMDHLHRKKNRDAQLPDYTVALAFSPEQLYFEQELRAEIEMAIKSLPEKCELVFRLSREEGYSNKQIASELNLSEKTVEAHITRALKGIKGNLAATLPVFIICVLEKSKFFS